MKQRHESAAYAAVLAVFGRRSRRLSASLRVVGGALLLAAVAIASPATAAPDLVVQNLAVDPSSGANGTVVHLTMDIKNQGSSSALASTTRVRINQDSSSVTSTDPILCNISTPSLAAGSVAQIGCSATISGRPSGTSFLWAIADVNKTAGQENVTNDRSHISFDVSNQSPDLIVTSLSLVPKSLRNGEEISIGVTIKNQGTANAQSSTTRVRINQDPATVLSTDAILCNILTPQIAAGASVEVGCELTLSARPAGTNYVWAIADVNKTAGQSDTTNDRRSGSITVSSEATDLVVDSVTVDPPIGANGKSITISAVIRNQGTAQAPATVTRVRIGIDPEILSSTDPSLCGAIDTPSLDPGETTLVTCKPELSGRPAGVNYIWVVADATNLAGQSDRTNDRLSAEFTIDPQSTPDMIVKSVTVSPSNPASGSMVTLTARIANDGKTGAPASKTRFVINQNPAGVGEEGDIILCEQINTPSLSSGSSILINCKPTLTDVPAGPSFVWAVADATGLTGEANRDNNTRSVALNVEPGPAPDLVIDSIVATPASAGTGGAVSITAIIRNQGVGNAAASSARIRLSRHADGAFETDPIVCDAIATEALVAGSAIPVSCTWTLTSEAPGTAYLWITADVDDTAGQINRTNDSASRAFTILAPDAADLAITRLVVRPRKVRNGQGVVIRARVDNLGSKKAKASLMTFRINQDPNDVSPADEVLCSARPTPALAPTESASVRCAVQIENRPLGENVVWAIADTTGVSGDGVPSNNIARKILTVEPACTDPEISPVLEWPIEQVRVVEDYASYGSVPLSGGHLGYHSGADLRSQLPIAADQLPVYAAADGEVVLVKKACPSPADPVVNPPSGSCAAGWGNFVVVRHGDGISTVYAHLGEVSAVPGCVVAGDRIGTVGSSGSVTNPVQLHFDVLADLADPVTRQQLGIEHYRKFHPFIGRTPESDDGLRQTHLDPRDFMTRNRIRITADTVASRGRVTGGTAAYLAKDQEYVSYGELVPGYVMIDLPWPKTPEDGAPYSDDKRYGWVSIANTTVLATGLMPGTRRVDGYTLFQLDGVGSNYVSLRELPSAASAEITKAWGGQQFAPAGLPFTDTVSGQVWQPLFVPGTAATGTGKPRKAFVEADLLGPPPGH